MAEACAHQGHARITAPALAAAACADEENPVRRRATVLTGCLSRALLRPGPAPRRIRRRTPPYGSPRTVPQAHAAGYAALPPPAAWQRVGPSGRRGPGPLGPSGSPEGRGR